MLQPLYVLENALTVDTEYYLTNQLEKPLTRMFSPMMKNPKSLFNGAHTMKVSRAAPVRGPPAPARVLWFNLLTHCVCGCTVQDGQHR